MGRLIQFPIDRRRDRRHHVQADVFSAFGELQRLERSQMRFVAGSAAVALLLACALQLAFG